VDTGYNLHLDEMHGEHNGTETYSYSGKSICIL